MLPEELTPEERRAIEDFLALNRQERDTFLEFAAFAHRPHKHDASIRNLDALIDLVRKRPALLEMMKRAETWDGVKRFLLMMGGLAGAVVAIMAVFAKVTEFWK